MTTLSIDLQDTWAILIGIGEFQDSELHNVPAVKNNLAALSKLLINKDIVGIPKEHIITLENQASLHSELVRALDLLPKRLDTLIIYYVGHGFYHGNDVYLATVDTVQTHPETGLAFADLWELTCLRATNLLYLLDCCFSGMAVKSIEKQVERNISVLTATLPTNTAKAPNDKPYTAFTEDLLRLLEQGCGNEPTLTPRMVYEELKKRYEELNKSFKNKWLPEPWHNDFLHTEEIRFAKNRAYKPDDINEYWNVPSRNRHFTGREAFLAEIQRVFSQHPVVALTNFGGMGKTQIAKEYAYRQKKQYFAVLWVNAESQTTLDSELAALVVPLKLPQQQEQSANIQAVKTWLLREKQWLLILDNADDDMADKIIPLCRELTSHEERFILVTSRRSTLDKCMYSLSLSQFTPEEGEQFLLQATDNQHLEATEKAALRQLGEELGWLPLALDQAIAYILENEVSFSHYLDLYRAYKPELLDERQEHEEHPHSVVKTLSLSFEKLNPKALEILRYCAFLPSEAIPESVLSSECNPLEFNRIMKVILRYSLLQRDDKTQTVSIHRLVQWVLLQTLEKEKQREYAQKVVNAVNRAMPRVDDNWLICVPFLPSALASVELIERWAMESVEVARLLNETSDILYYQGRYTERKFLVERSLTIREKFLGKQHPDYAQSLNNLAYFYDSQGKYEQALPLFEQALQIREQVLGKQHPDYATSLNNLALLYYSQGKYEQALPLYEQALQIIEQVLGKQHPYYASSLLCLANVYSSQGKYEQALPLYEQALQIREQVLGKQHPDYASSLDALAFAYSSQGKYEQALPLLEQALQIDEQVSGKQHPDYATTLNNFALCHINQHNYTQAKPLLEQALAIREKTLDKEHPYLGRNLQNLAKVYAAQGDTEQAKPLFERALSIYRQKLPADHRWRKECEENYAECLKQD